MDTQIIFLRQDGPEYQFSVYPETLDTQFILNELSELGPINTVEFLVTYLQDQVGIVKVTFENVLSILPRTRWVRTYIRCQSNVSCMPMDIDDDPVVTNAIHTRPIASLPSPQATSPPPRHEESL